MLKEILEKGNTKELRSLFAFDNEQNDLIVKKFNLWAKYYFSEYFTSDDAPFHKEMDIYNVKLWKGELGTYTNVGFRGCAKTSRTKLFIAFAIANDLTFRRKYVKVLSYESKNAVQIVTDIYNMLITVKKDYPEIFKKTNKKREERKDAFDTFTGVKIVAGTVGTTQRGALQGASRPDFIWFEDFESRDTVRSGVKTNAIWQNMEEARTGLSKDGVCLYTCNYISERGNVHRLVNKENNMNIVHIIPILKNGEPTWDRYSLQDIEYMKETDDDFEGERMCQPSAGDEIMFDREVLDKMPKLVPVRHEGKLRVYFPYNPSHRYALGADVAGGVGLDSSASVIIDFENFPARVVACYDDNTIAPDDFGHELYNQSYSYGKCIVAPEVNNHGHATIAILKAKDPKIIYKRKKRDVSISERKRTEYGWATTRPTKSKMINDLVNAVNKGHLILTDPRLIREAKSYTRDDLMEGTTDPRLMTRHFDLLTACAIAYQIHADVKPSESSVNSIVIEDMAQPYDPFAIF